MTQLHKEGVCYLETRISKLEWQYQEHTDEIREVKISTNELTSALRDISVCLQQIKWTAFGAVAMLIMSQLGLGETLGILITT